MQSLTEFITRLDLRIAWLPDWATSAILIASFALLAWWLHSIVFAIVERLVSGQDLFRRSLVARTKAPSRLAVIMIGIALAVAVAPLTWSEADDVWRVIVAGMVVLIGWFLLTSLHIWIVLYLRRFKLDAEDNLLARKHVTQFRILERIGKIVIIIVTLAAALMTFPSVRQYGVSLLASAGAASLIIGLALQPVLKNSWPACSSPLPSRSASTMRY